LGGAGGSGVGGTGYSSYTSATPGKVNTGSGGGGGGWSSSTSTTKGGDGAPGIAIIRIPSSYVSNASYTSNGLSITTTGTPNVIYSGNDIIYSFVNSGTITFNLLPKFITTAELLIVAGGGQGGYGWGGGGGAGGLISSTDYVIEANTYTITVGAGGTGGHSSGVRGNNGSNTLAFGYTAYGGGGGGSWDGTASYPAAGNNLGRRGGSGGGTGSKGAPGGEGLAISWGRPPQGNPGGFGGSNNSSYDESGGGGGAGQVGYPGPTAAPIKGQGGSGLASEITGNLLYYAGGGGGSGTTGRNAKGGNGGGGDGAGGTAGNVNTGGGGGSSNPSGTPDIGKGGSGIVIIRYPTDYPYTANVTGLPNVIYANSNVIYRFWQSGTLKLDLI
jgi:hypothetical protein